MSLAVLVCDRLQSLSELCAGFSLCAHKGNVWILFKQGQREESKQGSEK